MMKKLRRLFLTFCLAFALVSAATAAHASDTTERDMKRSIPITIQEEGVRRIPITIQEEGIRRLATDRKVGAGQVTEILKSVPASKKGLNAVNVRLG
jgi:hypothetical protein